MPVSLTCKGTRAWSTENAGASGCPTRSTELISPLLAEPSTSEQGRAPSLIRRRVPLGASYEPRLLSHADDLHLP
jgi:hypothetical protein